MLPASAAAWLLVFIRSRLGDLGVDEEQQEPGRRYGELEIEIIDVTDGLDTGPQAGRKNYGYSMKITFTPDEDAVGADSIAFIQRVRLVETGERSQQGLGPDQPQPRDGPPVEHRPHPGQGAGLVRRRERPLRPGQPADLGAGQERRRVDDRPPVRPDAEHDVGVRDGRGQPAAGRTSEPCTPW